MSLEQEDFFLFPLGFSQKDNGADPLSQESATFLNLRATSLVVPGPGSYEEHPVW